MESVALTTRDRFVAITVETHQVISNATRCLAIPLWHKQLCLCSYIVHYNDRHAAIVASQLIPLLLLQQIGSGLVQGELQILFETGPLAQELAPFLHCVSPCLIQQSSLEPVHWSLAVKGAEVAPTTIWHSFFKDEEVGGQFSNWQVEEQPSSSTAFPSSHCSPVSTTLLPQHDVFGPGTGSPPARPVQETHWLFCTNLFASHAHVVSEPRTESPDGLVEKSGQLTHVFDDTYWFSAHKTGPAVVAWVVVACWVVVATVVL